MCPSVPLSVLRSASSFAGSSRDLRGAAARRVTGAAAPRALQGVVGVWDGALYPDGRGGAAGAPFSLLQNAADDATRGGVVGRVAFPGDDSVAAEVRLLEASATTYVALVGPYFDAAADAQVMLLLDARRDGERMWGRFRVRPVGAGDDDVRGDRCVDGRFVAVKARRVAAA